MDEVVKCIATLLDKSHPVLSITDLTDDVWYRNRKEIKGKPWLSLQYSVVDPDRWKKLDPCLYFVTDSTGNLKYVGTSINKLNDRWRLSPAYDANHQPLNRHELFHSQCMDKICGDFARIGAQDYTVSTLHSSEMIEALSLVDHPIGLLSKLPDDGDIAVVAVESWIIKYFKQHLWNKRQ